MTLDEVLIQHNNRIIAEISTFGTVDVRNSFYILASVVDYSVGVSVTSAQLMINVLGGLMEVADLTIKKALAWPGTSAKVNGMIASVFASFTPGPTQLLSSRHNLRMSKQSYSINEVHHATMDVVVDDKPYYITVPLEPFRNASVPLTTVDFAFFNHSALFARPFKVTLDGKGPVFQMLLPDW
jgi:hypothetical protein